MASEPLLGEIRIFPYNFAPRGWADCNGQLMDVEQNLALSSLLGTTYGGDGQATFGLPDFRGRLPVHQGQGPGLRAWVLGEMIGSEQTTLTTNQMPSHTHALNANTFDATSRSPTGIPAAGGQYGPPNGAVSMKAGSLATAGGSQPFDNLQPILVLRFCICVEGIYPSRN